MLHPRALFFLTWYPIQAAGILKKIIASGFYQQHARGLLGLSLKHRSGSIRKF
jgi:hypothetical protein